MGLDAAIAKTTQLRDALGREVERARGEGALLRAMDAEQLLKSAGRRAEFNGLSTELEKQIAAELEKVAAERGLTEVTLSSLSTSEPDGAASLALILGEVRALAAALAKADALNRSTAQRALACIHGYLTALSLLPNAYDRRGCNLVPDGDRTTHSLRI